METPQGTTTGPRQLRRRPDQGHIAGVCAGVAEYFNVDPVIVRIAAVVLLISGPGFFAYVLAWIFVPAAEPGPAPLGSGSAKADGVDRGKQVLGIVLLVIAVSVLWGDWWAPGRRWFFPLGLLAIGVWLLLRGGGDDATSPAAPPPPPPVWSPPAPAMSTELVRAESIDADDTLTDEDLTDDTLAGDGPTDDTLAQPGPLLDEGDVPTAPHPWGRPAPVVSEPTDARRHRRMLGPIVMGALLVWAGIAWLLGVSVETGLAIGLCIVGVGFVLGAFVGGGWVLIMPAVLIGAALLFATLVDIPLSGPIGERTWTPRTIADVEDSYQLSVGKGTLDLTQIDLRPGDRLEIEASVGVGHLVIEVPEGISVDVQGEVAAGETFLLGARSSGVGVSDERARDVAGPAGTVELDLQVGLGQIEVITTSGGRD